MRSRLQEIEFWAHLPNLGWTGKIAYPAEFFSNLPNPPYRGTLAVLMVSRKAPLAQLVLLVLVVLILFSVVARLEGAQSTIALSVCGLALGVPVILWASRRNPEIRRLMLPALLWRAGVVVFLLLSVYPHYRARRSADAWRYYRVGQTIASQIEHGRIDEVEIGTGSEAYELLTGLFYVPFGPSFEAMFVISSLVGLLGVVLFCKAFSLWYRGEEARRYLMFCLFLPSLALWTSIHGKDPWVCCGLGLAAYGYSSWLKRPRPRALVYSVLGLLLTFAIRPHIALALLLAVGISEVLGKHRARTLAARTLLMAALVPLIFLLSQETMAFVGLEEYSVEAATQRIIEQGERLRSGTFAEVRRMSTFSDFVFQLPSGAVRVLFRPWPWEAHNAFAALAAAENLVLAVLCIWNVRTLAGLFYRLRGKPYLLFCFVFAALLIVILSTLPNFGLVVRQKAQLIPFLFVLIFASQNAQQRRRGYSGTVVSRFRPLPRGNHGSVQVLVRRQEHSGMGYRRTV